MQIILRVFKTIFLIQSKVSDERILGCLHADDIPGTKAEIAHDMIDI